MDNIYEAVKGFLKAIVNLFTAVIDLFAGIINGIAFILGKLKPKASQRLSEIGKGGFEGKLGGIDRRFLKRRDTAFSGNEEALVDAVREELREKVTSQERYYYLYAKAEDGGNGFYVIVFAILAFALSASNMLYLMWSADSIRILSVVVMAVICAAACIAVMQYRKRLVRNRLVRLILEEEFKDIEWGKIHPIMEVNRDENAVEKKELAK
ncbi:MAG: hypothetical protein NC429_00610 [Lachnospiraceae bacterium]|nr:hypothetical protein [Lachnospiraceae bacterium]